MPRVVGRWKLVSPRGRGSIGTEGVETYELGLISRIPTHGASLPDLEEWS